MYRVTIDSRIKIENGYTTTFKGEVSLSRGKLGKLTVLDSAISETTNGLKKPPKCKKCGNELNDGICELCEFRKNSNLFDPSAFRDYSGFDGSFAKLHKKQNR